jgi:hypothetical protein
MGLHHDGQVPHLVMVLGLAASAPSQLCVARLLPDGSAFEAYTKYPPSVLTSFWSDPGGGDAVFTDDGHMCIAYTDYRMIAPTVLKQHDIGSGGWVLASRLHASLGSDSASGYARMAVHDGVVYVAAQLDRAGGGGSVDELLGVWVCPPDPELYTPWVAEEPVVGRSYAAQVVSRR